MKIKRIAGILLAVCLVTTAVVFSVGADFAATEDTAEHEQAHEHGEACEEAEHQHEMQVSCVYQWCWCGYVIPGPTAHAFVWEIFSHYGHGKFCKYCWISVDFEAHGYITVNGATYCGSCGYTP